MSRDWLQTTLGNACSRITDGAHQSPKSAVVGKPMASVKDLTFFGVNLADARRISEADFNALVSQGCRPEIGDVLIAKDGNSALDTVCIQREAADFVLLSSVAILRPDRSIIDSRYLAYVLRNPPYIEYLKANFISGAAIPRVVLRDFKRAKLILPPLPEQRAIAATLGALDDKIELNRKMNATLEAMARALFRDWFVDFGPTQRKAAGSTDPATILGHFLPNTSQAPALAASFPDCRGADGLPAGWKLSAIGDVAKNHSETMDLKKRHRVIFINTGDVSQGAFLHANYSDAKGLPGQAKKKIEVGDILYSEIRPKNKRFAFVDFSAPDHVVSTKFMVLRTTSTVSPMHLYFLVSSPEAVDEFNRIAESRSGTFPQITFESIKHYPVILANDEVMKAFSEILELFYGLQRANDQENQTLAQTRDLLLPRLISGELRVADLSDREIAA